MRRRALDIIVSITGLIAAHVLGIADGRTYAEVSHEYLAGGGTDETLAGQRTTLLMGESLRGMLLNAYAFWTFGTIALIATPTGVAPTGIHGSWQRCPDSVVVWNVR